MDIQGAKNFRPKSVRLIFSTKILVFVMIIVVSDISRNGVKFSRWGKAHQLNSCRLQLNFCVLEYSRLCYSGLLSVLIEKTSHR